VQRFRVGFTVLPAMRQLGAAWDVDAKQARRLAQQVGYVLAAELRAHGVDLTFAPVLDVDHGNSSVIGDRAFHSNPRAISDLATGLIKGFKQGGMSSVGKHFPGHGHVKADSHHDLPIDDRPRAAIEESDLVPFRRLIENDLGGIMPAHVIYPAVDAKPAGFSEIWLKEILRGQLGFDGMVFSDDLSMEGARGAGSEAERAHAALAAGCDMVLLCNDAAGADRLLAELDCQMTPTALTRLARIHGRGGARTAAQLQRDRRYLEATAAVRAIGVNSGELPLYR
jgi:beta-N-acetylhexosaminidase